MKIERHGFTFTVLSTTEKKGAVHHKVECDDCRKIMHDGRIDAHVDSHDARYNRKRDAERKRILGITPTKILPGQLGLNGIGEDK